MHGGNLDIHGVAQKQNVRLLRGTYEAFASRDYAAMVEAFDPAIELREPPEIPDAEVWRGPDGVVAVLRKLQEAFADMEFHLRDFFPVEDRVLVSMDWVWRGVGSGVASGVGLWHLWWFNDGLAVRIHAYLDHAQALDAAGLSE